MSHLGPLARLAPLVCLFLVLPRVAAAQTIWDVGDQAALQNALSIASPGDTIRFTGNITLSAPLAMIFNSNLTIDGGGFTLSGANQYRGFIVGDASGFSTPPPVNVVIQNLTIVNTVGSGGAGQPGLDGGGGGSAGIGGAIVVANTATAALYNVTITNSAAVGGPGGDTAGPAGGAPGGFAVSFNYSGGFGGGNPTRDSSAAAAVEPPRRLPAAAARLRAARVRRRWAAGAAGRGLAAGSSCRPAARS